MAALEYNGETPFECEVRFNKDGIPEYEIDRFVSPGVRYSIANLKRKLKIGYDELKNMFFKTKDIDPIMLSNFPFEEAWKKIGLARKRKK